MRKFTTIAITLLLMAALAGCYGEMLPGVPTPVPGSGRAATETRQVSGFTGVEVSGSGRLILERTGTESLTITADDNLLPYLRSDVVDGVLIIGTRPNRGINTRVRPEYRLTAKHLDKLELSGSVEATVLNVDAEKLEVALSGSCEATVEGEAARQEVWLSGSNIYRAERLASRFASIESNGSSNCAVQVRDELTVKASGSSKVEYVGDPAVSRSLEGSATVVRR